MGFELIPSSNWIVKVFRGVNLGSLRVSAEAFEQSRVQAVADVLWERDGFGVAENLDGFARGIDDDPAIGASGEMFFEVDADARIEHAIEIAR